MLGDRWGGWHARKKFKVAFFEVEPWEEEYLKSSLWRAAICEADCYFSLKTLEDDAGSGARGAEAISTFIRSRVGREQLGRFPGLKPVATRSTGIDHIDIEACRQRRIAVVNVPNYGESTVAEHAFALILSLSRKVFKAYLRTSSGDFSQEGLTGFDLRNKTLGVIGAGRIGLHTIRIAKGFAMRVLVYDLGPSLGCALHA